jgi:RecA/RadA recombinase
MPQFDHYRFVFDDVEERQEFDMEYLFGDLAERLEAPPLGNSDTVDQMVANHAALHEGKKPYIYVVDSLDALTTSEELEKEHKKAVLAAKGSPDALKQISETFAGRKAAQLSEFLRLIKKRVAESNSMVLITQQLRINMNAGAFGKKYRTSGGEAPFFYSHVRPVLSKVKTHKTQTGGSKRQIGVRTKFDLEKNSITGKSRQGEFDIFYDFGIDDVGSIIDFLVEEGFWKKTGRTINATHLDMAAERNKLVRMVERQNAEEQLQQVAQEAWTELESALRLSRKRRF